MSVGIIMGLLGGLALFLYGMQMMSGGLEAAAGNRMKSILERLTANRFLGVAVGAGITAVIQSSSATTVMVVGFVNSSLMTLKQAVWIIMGANIGTTITGQLIALDVGAAAPLFSFIGVAMAVFGKKDNIRHYGTIVAGLGILFIGMDMMSNSMEPLRESESFVGLMTRFKNPILGIIVGMVFTAIIQSSSASVGILQALAVSGLIGFDAAVFVLFGQNIGTCVTAVLASIGTSRSAKRTTIIHLMFNIIGTIIFTLVCISFPLTDAVAALTPDNPASQIANMHTLFNLTTTLILLPFGGALAELATKILPETETEEDGEFHLEFIKAGTMSGDVKIGAAAIASESIKNELQRMTEMAQRNVNYSFAAALGGSSVHYEDIENTEEYVDYLNKEISKYISSILAHENSLTDTAALNAFFKISGNIERISDHAVNISGYVKTMNENGISFSEYTRDEIEQLKSVCMEAMDLINLNSDISVGRFSKISAVEQKIDDMTEMFRQNQLARMSDKSCSDEACILYSEMLTDFERIGDHVLNIGQALAGIKLIG